jgi:hypothetical protein
MLRTIVTFCSSTLATIHQTTRRHNPEDCSINISRVRSKDLTATLLNFQDFFIRCCLSFPLCLSRIVLQTSLPRTRPQGSSSGRGARGCQTLPLTFNSPIALGQSMKTNRTFFIDVQKPLARTCTQIKNTFMKKLTTD